MKGICPLCREKGDAGEGCVESGCDRIGYHYVPADYLDRSEAKSRRVKDPLVGLEIGKYILVKKIGEGGMGAVYVALQKPLLREVALKLIKFFSDDNVMYERFVREARVVAVLDHPNILKLYDFGIGSIFQMENVPFMVTEYVAHAGRLRDAMKRYYVAGKLMPHEIILRIASQLLSALQSAHSQGLVHRDIKPTNIMIKPTEGNPYFVKILDFGLAKAVEKLAAGDDLTKTDAFVGTPLYVAPEQIPSLGADKRRIDHRVDLYATGIMLFQMLLGKSPFPATTTQGIITHKLDPAFAPINPQDLEQYPEYADFLKRALAWDPEERFTDAKQMKAELEKLLDPEARFTKPTEAPEELFYGSESPGRYGDAGPGVDGEQPGDGKDEVAPILFGPEYLRVAMPISELDVAVDRSPSSPTSSILPEGGKDGLWREQTLAEEHGSSRPESSRPELTQPDQSMHSTDGFTILARDRRKKAVFVTLAFVAMGVLLLFVGRHLWSNSSRAGDVSHHEPTRLVATRTTGAAIDVSTAASEKGEDTADVSGEGHSTGGGEAFAAAGEPCGDTCESRSPEPPDTAGTEGSSPATRAAFKAITIEVHPVSARVFINGKRTAASPFVYQFHETDRRVRIRANKKGYEPLDVTVEYPAVEPDSRLSLKLKKKPRHKPGKKKNLAL